MSLLEVVGLSKNFGSLAAVRAVSMTVAPGELRAVIGPNGAGKTTFFNMLTGAVVPSAGQVRFEGKDVTTVPAWRRVKLGMARTFQITEIFPELTVAENLRIAAETAAGLRLRFWLGRAAAASLAREVEELLHQIGLTARAGRLVGELAHGDQRAAEIGMALAVRPRLLLLDEPTAGMGEQETYDITQLIARLRRERALTIVLIEHDMRVVFHLADRIAVLDQGALLCEGTPAEIAADTAVQAAYLGQAA